MLAQTDTSDTEASRILSQLSTRERVGQLFLVSFFSDSAGPNTYIAEFVQDYSIGGVLIKADNDNVTTWIDSPTQLGVLANEIQKMSSLASQLESAGDESTGNDLQSQFVPLFIAMSHEGDGPPFSQVHTGLTPLPSNMAVGATWLPEHAKTVGAVAGQELSFVGVNMLLGPSLDVLESPIAEVYDSLGTRSFGGDPFWVGQMGEAYTQGVHEGSNGRVAVVAKYFPGLGSSDRLPGEEVPTVRKSLEQLKQIELAPFFAVTSGAKSVTATIDALLSSHIRFQGFQGNIRESTRPISFDKQALDSFLSIPEFNEWRSNGGVLVSDELGVPAVKRYFDPELLEFPHRQVALDAFLAGNDVLTLSDFSLSGRYIDHVVNVKDTIDWFHDMYIEDVDFKNRVDESVLRILELKLRMYGGDFSLENTLIPLGQIQKSVGTFTHQVSQIAQDSISLIVPAVSAGEVWLAEAPRKSDNIVIFTDVRELKQCSTCPALSPLELNTIRDEILKLFGPQGTNQVLPGRIVSYSFTDLGQALLTEAAYPAPATDTLTTEPPDELEIDSVMGNVENADWIVFAMLDISEEHPESDIVSTFLSSRPDIVARTETVVLAFNAPYFLDTTDISKLSAYYGVYSKTSPFIEAAVRALYGQIHPHGASPVSVPAISYDLIEVTSPDPNQIIQLHFDQPLLTESDTPQPFDVRLGDTLTVKTSAILDHNARPVPDGTLVQFTVSYLSEGLGLDVPQPKVETIDGVASIDLKLNVPGQIQIKASSEDARASVGLSVSVFEDQPAIVQELTPVPTPTKAPPAPTVTEPPIKISPTATKQVTNTVSAVQPSEPDGGSTTAEPIQELIIMLISIAGLVCISIIALLVRPRGYQGRQMGVWLALLAMSMGLVAYNWIMFSLPGANAAKELLGIVTPIFSAWFCSVISVIVGKLSLTFRNKIPG